MSSRTKYTPKEQGSVVHRNLSHTIYYYCYKPNMAPRIDKLQRNRTSSSPARPLAQNILQRKRDLLSSMDPPWHYYTWYKTAVPLTHSNCNGVGPVTQHGRFHKTRCKGTGSVIKHAWPLVLNNKLQTDRTCYLARSLADNTWYKTVVPLAQRNCNGLGPVTQHGRLYKTRCKGTCPVIQHGPSRRVLGTSQHDISHVQYIAIDCG